MHYSDTAYCEIYILSRYVSHLEKDYNDYSIHGTNKTRLCIQKLKHHNWFFILPFVSVWFRRNGYFSISNANLIIVYSRKRYAFWLSIGWNLMYVISSKSLIRYTVLINCIQYLLYCILDNSIDIPHSSWKCMA